MPKVSVTRLRPELARWIDHVRRSPTEAVVVTAHGREVAALVSLEALALVWNAQDERRVGPIDPATGRPFGREWVSRNFGGH
jgi:prevent-host-death family protein